MKNFFCVLCAGLLFLVGCASNAPKGFLKLPDNYLEKHELQTRQYDTTDEEKILSSVAGVLQDLGFTLDNSETKLGLVAASKKADATNKGQVAGAIVMDCLSIFSSAKSHSYSTGSSALSQCDAEQRVKASVITKLSADKTRIIVRVNFQRVVWNRAGMINKVETIDDKEIYQKFYEGLSKSIFLEAHNI